MSDEIQAPANHGPSLPFIDLVQSVFEPLLIETKNTSGRRGNAFNARQTRRAILERFIRRWKKDVGPNMYPALRMMMPDRDRDRPMYSMKEHVLGKIIVRVLGLAQDSADATAVLKWKLPGRGEAGDFGLRAYDVIAKRPFKADFSDMTIDRVNELFDELSRTSKMADQQEIITTFYKEMHPLELKWVIRIILRSMKLGVTEKTVLSSFHPDAEKLFNVTSSLRQVCYELYDTEHRLEDKDKDIKVFQCFQPQRAAFKKKGLDDVVAAMGRDKFCIEEKLDGERIQMHKKGDEFRWFSRNAKDYTYLYGDSTHDTTSALTKYLKEAFVPGVYESVFVKTL